MDILYGRQSVREALRARRRLFWRLVVAEGVKETGIVADIIRLAQKAGCPVTRALRSELDRLGHVNHQGVVLEVSGYPYVALDEMFGQAQEQGQAPLLLLLDQLQDPQNLGTLLRTAEAVGVHGVIIPRHRAVAITPAVSHASVGAVEHLHVARVTNLVRTIEWLKERGIWVLGLERAPTAQDYTQVDLSGPLALVVGSEGQGLRRLVRERCDLLVALPMRGRIGSLNAAVAGSIVLYAALHARDI